MVGVTLIDLGKCAVSRSDEAVSKEGRLSRLGTCSIFAAQYGGTTRTEYVSHLVTQNSSRLLYLLYSQADLTITAMKPNLQSSACEDSELRGGSENF